jgi:hypothetical protein
MPVSRGVAAHRFAQLSMLKRKLEENDKISVSRLNSACSLPFEMAGISEYSLVKSKH